MKSLRIARATTKKISLFLLLEVGTVSTSELLYTNNKRLENIELSSGLDKNLKKT